MADKKLIIIGLVATVFSGLFILLFSTFLGFLEQIFFGIIAITIGGALAAYTTKGTNIDGGVHGTISGIIGGAILGALLVLPYSHSSIVLIIRDIFVGALTGGFMFGLNFGIVGAIIGNIIRNYQTNRKFNGYLVCDKCGAYYELKESESPDDFTDECDCGGKLQHKKSLKTPMKFSLDKKVLFLGVINHSNRCYDDNNYC